MAVNNKTMEEKEALNLYKDFELASGVCLLLFSMVGVASNSLLLISIWKNPNKLFRSPTTNFIIGLAVADLVTALTTEPFFALYYFVCYHSDQGSDFKTIFKIGGVISTVTVSLSFVIVLALSCSQYVAIAFPHKYKKLITRKRTLTIVLSSWVYFFCFGFLIFGDINEELYYKVHLATHSSLVSLILLVVLVLLYRSFKSKLSEPKVPPVFKMNTSQKPASNDHLNYARWNKKQKSRNPLLDLKHDDASSIRISIASEETLDKEESVVSDSSFKDTISIRAHRKSQRKTTIERQLTYVTFYLAAILLISALPHVILAQTFLYKKDSLNWRQKIDFRIALLVSDIFLLLKVGLDPFVYSWRLPSYRQALRDTIQKCRPGKPVKTAKASLSANKI